VFGLLMPRFLQGSGTRAPSSTPATDTERAALLHPAPCVYSREPCSVHRKHRDTNRTRGSRRYPAASAQPQQHRLFGHAQVLFVMSHVYSPPNVGSRVCLVQVSAISYAGLSRALLRSPDLDRVLRRLALRADRFVFRRRVLVILERL